MRSSTVISLLDVGMFVQRELALYQARKRNPRNPEAALDPNWRSYDSGPLLEALLKDVFDNTCEEHPSEYLVTAKALLQNSGMNHNAAHQLCNRAFDMIVDYIGAVLPHLKLSDTSTEAYADLTGTWDVVVTEFRARPVDPVYEPVRL
jgi:hypothetical protein